MRNAVVMAIKDLHLLWRDKFALFWVLIFPLMMALFVGAIFGGSGPTAGLSLIVVDLDSTAASRAFVETLNRSGAIRLAVPDTRSTHTRDTARRSVASGDATKASMIGGQITACLGDTFKGALGAAGSLKANVKVSVDVKASASASGSGSAKGGTGWSESPQ